MKIIKYYSVLITGIILFLSTTALIIKDNNSAVDNTVKRKIYDNSKIIKFNHQLHIKDAGVKCEDCHAGSTTSVNSKDNLNPKGHAFCQSCHDTEDQKNCSFCHYDGIKKKLRASDRELYFNHKYHTQNLKQQCTSCHIGLENVKFSKESPLAFPPMTTCNTCHNSPQVEHSSNTQATNSCENCHKNLTGLMPSNHRKVNFLNEHKTVFDVNDPAGVNSGNNCMMCHSNNYCETCHQPVTFKGQNSKENFFAPYYTKEGATRMDRAELQKLNTAHKDLNYRYTHGLDANSKRFECKTCHETETFCSSCHDANGENPAGILPSSHKQPGFITGGVNTGGGLHALLGRRDIESCQACHDASGTDPVCIRCHFDQDGMKGTNPKTHETGFMKDEKGIWHDTQGAVCYVCHYDANARPDGVRGKGFCGYCHN